MVNKYLMDKVFEYLDYPKIPDSLLRLKLEEIEKQENIYPRKYYPYYKQYAVGSDIFDFLRSIFDFDFEAVYQVIRQGIHTHKDRNRNECYNYIMSTGGETAHLNILDDDKKTIIHTEYVQPERWHRLDVTKYHNVKGITNVRYSISVTPLSAIRPR
jgi:hypothetical protein